MNNADQLARFEFASIQTSESLKALVHAIRDGVSEAELEHCFHGRGLPLSCHPMISVGDKARRGLSSPSSRRARRGDPFTAAYGVQGALTCRAGMIAAGPEDLDDELRSFYPAFVRNYFATVAAWYQHVAVGAVAGDVVTAVNAVRDERLFRLAVNPGHSIHLDEWVSSPFQQGSQVRLRSGMALQMDIIPISQGPFCCSNAEDGVFLADDALRERLQTQYPSAWGRITARAAFMREALGIRLDESVLPVSNLAGWLPPVRPGARPGVPRVREQRGRDAIISIMWTKMMGGPRKKAPKTIAVIDPDRCFGAFACSICQAACPVAGCIVEEPDRDGRMVCAVRADLCIGCGLCVTLGNPTAPQQREFGCPADYDAINMMPFEEVVKAIRSRRGRSTSRLSTGFRPRFRPFGPLASQRLHVPRRQRMVETRLR